MGRTVTAAELAPRQSHRGPCWRCERGGDLITREPEGDVCLDCLVGWAIRVARRNRIEDELRRRRFPEEKLQKFLEARVELAWDEDAIGRLEAKLGIDPAPVAPVVLA